MAKVKRRIFKQAKIRLKSTQREIDLTQLEIRQNSTRKASTQKQHCKNGRHCLRLHHKITDRLWQLFRVRFIQIDKATI